MNEQMNFVEYARKYLDAFVATVEMNLGFSGCVNADEKYVLAWGF